MYDVLYCMDYVLCVMWKLSMLWDENGYLCGMGIGHTV